MNKQPVSNVATNSVTWISTCLWLRAHSGHATTIRQLARGLRMKLNCREKKTIIDCVTFSDVQ